MYYYANGISIEKKIENDLFYIENPYPDKRKEYWFNGDGILYDLDSHCVSLYDKFLHKIFDDIDEYYRELDLLPRWVVEAGMNSDLSIQKDTFAERINQNNIKDINKHLYLSDCQSLISSLQNALINMNWSFVHYYIYLSEIEPFQIEEDGVFFLQSQEVCLVYSMLNNFIIYAYSCFDLLTKIAYEFENIVIDFEKYPKLKSLDRLYGDKKFLKNINFESTIFEISSVSNIIMNLRNELIHNGSWEQHQKIFYEIKNRKIIEKFIFFPDTENGILKTYKNRKRFFGLAQKINYELPKIYSNILHRIQNTLVKINLY